MHSFRSFDELTKAIARAVSRREVLSRSVGLVGGMVLAFRQQCRADGAGAKKVQLFEIPYRTRKFCIYLQVPKNENSAATFGCSVAPDAPCPADEVCLKQRGIEIKVAKIADDNDKKWERADGAWCYYAGEPRSIHHEDGVFFCSSVIRCAKNGEWLPFARAGWDQATCVGTPDPDDEGGAICPGLSACKSEKFVLPRPAKGKTKKESP